MGNLSKKIVTDTFKKNRLFLILSIISGITRSFLMLLPTYFISKAINGMEEGNSIRNVLIYISFMLACQIVVMILYVLDTRINKYIFMMGSKLRKMALTNLFKNDRLPVIKEQLVDNVVNVSIDISMYYYESLSNMTWFIATLFGAIFLMMGISKTITLIIVFITFVQVGITLKFKKSIKQTVKQDVLLKGENLHNILSIYDHNDYLTINKSEKKFQQELFESNISRLFKNSYKKSLITSFDTLISSFLDIFKQVFILWISYNLFLQQKLLIGDVFALNSYMIWIVPVIIGIQSWLKERSVNDSNLELIDNLYGESDDFSSKKVETLLSSSLFTEITIKNIAMKNETNFTVKAGEIAVIKGASGVGKTTFAKALVGLNTLYDGKILINKSPIENYSQSELTANITYCPQDSFLFEDTIISNLILDDSKISEKTIDKLLLFFNLSHLPLKNPLTSNDINNLSDGEKKRLVLIRALVKDTGIYVFDEPTAGLDQENRIKFFQIIQENLSNKVVIIITHDEDLKILNNYKEILFK